MQKINRKKPFGTVFGIAGHRYEQDGKIFDAEGNEVQPGAPVEQQAGSKVEKPIEKTFTRAEMQVEIDKAVQKALAGVSEEKPAETEGLESEPDIEPEETSEEETEEEEGSEPQPNFASYRSIKSRTGILEALNEIKRKYMPDLEFSDGYNRTTLKKTLDEAVDKLEAAQGE